MRMLSALFAAAACTLGSGGLAHAAADDAGRADPALRARLLAGEAVRVIVELDPAPVLAREQIELSHRRALLPDADLLARRARDFATLKAPVRQVLGAQGVAVLRDYSHLPGLALELRHTGALDALLARSEVLAVAEDIRVVPMADAGLALIGQDKAAAVIGQTGAGTTVAVLDTGVDYTQAAFGACSAPGVPAGCRVVYAEDMATDDGQRDAVGHGSQVAGVVAMVAPGARIAALDVFGPDGSALSSDVIEGINWAIANRVAYNIVAINMSLGDGSSNASPCSAKTSNPFRQPIINARSAGILSVVSSGNNGHTGGITKPACTPEAVSVGATYNANYSGVTYSGCNDTPATVDAVACFSNSANYLTLLAPGSLVSVLGANVAGTSFAAPYASGALAVLAGAFPADTAAARQTRLGSAGKTVTDARNGVATPRIDLLAAMGPPPGNAFAAAIALSGEAGSAGGWTFNANAEAGEPAHAGLAGGRSVWWTWTAPATGMLSLDTAGSDFDTVLALYTGSAVSALVAVAANDHAPGLSTSALSARVVAGTRYHIAVDGRGGATGAVQLGWQFEPDAADLAVALAVTPAAGVVGEPLGYMLVMRNGGPAVAQGLAATLSVPGGTAAIASADPACSVAGGVVTCTLATLAAGGEASFPISLTPAAAGTLTVSAAVAAASPPDPRGANNSAVLQTTVVAAPPGGSGADGEVPVPGWVLALLAALLLGRAARRQ